MLRSAALPQTSHIYFTVVAHDALDQRAPPSNEIQFIGSNAPTLTPPILVLDLTNQNAALGSTVELAVAATGDAPLSCIWFFNGLRLTTTSSNVLDIAGLTVQQGGNTSHYYELCRLGHEIDCYIDSAAAPENRLGPRKPDGLRWLERDISGRRVRNRPVVISVALQRYKPFRRPGQLCGL
jgi:hypothetical protein